MPEALAREWEEALTALLEDREAQLAETVKALTRIERDADRMVRSRVNGELVAHYPAFRTIREIARKALGWS